MKFIDVNGDSAWSVTRRWNENDNKGYASYVTSKVQEMIKNGTKLDCADLALTLLVGYASENGLALQLTSADGKTTFDSNSDQYNSVGGFLNGTKDENGKSVPGVLSLSAANGDIRANSHTVDKSNREVGDMIFLTKPAGHVAVYNSKKTLAQGNLDGNNNPKIIEALPDWSNYNADGYGRPMNYYPDKSHVNRWNVLDVTPQANLKPLKALPCTGLDVK